MEQLDGCSFRTASALDDAKCFSAIQAFGRKAAGIFKYWETRVELSGGTTSTKNRLEQTNMSEALWVLQGAW